MSTNESLTIEQINEIVNYYRNNIMDLGEEKWQQVRKWLSMLIGDDFDDKSEDAKNKRIIFLGCILCDSVAGVKVQPNDSVKIDKHDDNENQESSFNELFQSGRENSLFNKVKKFCDSINFLRCNIDNIYKELSTLSEIHLKDLDVEKKLTHCDIGITEIENKFISKIKINNTVMSPETEVAIYKYLYCIFVENYGDGEHKELLPLIIFQAVIRDIGKLFKAVNNSFTLIKLNDELSDSDSSVIQHICNPNTYIYTKEYNEKYANELTSDMGFQKENGLLLNVFYYKDFGTSKSRCYGLDAKDWNGYFIDICKLLRDCGRINNYSFEKNYIAFLCLSNIFDVMFTNGEYNGDIAYSNSENIGDNFNSDSKFSVFNWNLAHIYGWKEREIKLMRKHILKILLNFIGITDVREKLTKKTLK